MPNRFFLAPLGAILILILISPTFADSGKTKPSSSPSPLGFTTDSRAAEIAAEARALSVPSPERARGWLRTLTEEPHVAGTPADHKTAVFVRDKLRAWGWKADLVEYQVLLNYPDRNVGASGPVLQLIQPTRQALPMTEKASGRG